jgi:hypothetical protein
MQCMQIVFQRQMITQQPMPSLPLLLTGVWPGTNEPFRISGASIHNLNGKQWQDLPHEVMH